MAARDAAGATGRQDAAGAAGTPRGAVLAADEAAVLCRDLVRVYAVEDVEVQALQGLSLRIEQGELVSVIGASGSGKSTLLSILSGIDRPTAGTARVAGYELTRLDRRQRVEYQRTAVGFVWQQTARNLVPYLTGAQNIALVLAVAGARDRRRRVAELLELTGAQGEADLVPAAMSGGQQQRVAIAVALANAPAVLLADEPTGELDDDSTARVLETLRSVNRELGTTTVIVTHDPAVADHVTRTIRIRDGRIAAETVRRTTSDGEQLATEYAVIDRVGRLQLPPEMVRALGLHDRVLLDRDGDRVTVRADDAGPAAAAGERARREEPVTAPTPVTAVPAAPAPAADSREAPLWSPPARGGDAAPSRPAPHPPAPSRPAPPDRPADRPGSDDVFPEGGW